jgi:hypothetical protein
MVVGLICGGVRRLACWQSRSPRGAAYRSTIDQAEDAWQD